MSPVEVAAAPIRPIWRLAFGDGMDAARARWAAAKDRAVLVAFHHATNGPDWDREHELADPRAAPDVVGSRDQHGRSRHGPVAQGQPAQRFAPRRSWGG